MRHGNLFLRLLANSVESETSFYEGTPCWEWTGKRCSRKWYGHVTIRMPGRAHPVPRKAHRVMAEIVLGRALHPDHETVDHACQYGPCINPWHLRLASRSDNCKDSKAKMYGGPRLVFEPIVDPAIYLLPDFERALPQRRGVVVECPFESFIMPVALTAIAAATAVVVAPPPSTVNVITDPGTAVTVIRRATNTSKQILITINKQDVVTVSKPALVPPPDHTMSGPAIDTAHLPAKAVGYSDERWRPIPAGCNQDHPELSDKSTCDTNVWIAYPTDIGAFRVPCERAQVDFIDPLVLFGQPGKSHLHSFYGNTGVTAFSTQALLSTTGNSTCAGGTLVRSAIWHPSMIDEHGLEVQFALNYYQKASYDFDLTKIVVPIPAGLRMVIGSATNTDPNAGAGRFTCSDSKGDAGWQTTLTRALAGGHCTEGGTLFMAYNAPLCWDGKNLDSSDHRSHLSGWTQIDAGGGNFPKLCPADHPVTLPQLSFQYTHTIKAGENVAKMYCSSDMDLTKEQCVSAHMDYWANFNEAVEAAATEHCIRQSHDGHDYLTCDGKTLY